MSACTYSESPPADYITAHLVPLAVAPSQGNCGVDQFDGVSVAGSDTAYIVSEVVPSSGVECRGLLRATATPSAYR